MNLGMTDTTWMLALGLSVAWGIPVLGWALRRVIRRAYGAGSSRPEGVPQKHGVDRRIHDD